MASASCAPAVPHVRSRSNPQGSAGSRVRHHAGLARCAAPAQRTRAAAAVATDEAALAQVRSPRHVVCSDGHAGTVLRHGRAAGDRPRQLPLRGDHHQRPGEPVAGSVRVRRHHARRRPRHQHRGPLPHRARHPDGRRPDRALGLLHGHRARRRYPAVSWGRQPRGPAGRQVDRRELLLDRSGDVHVRLHRRRHRQVLPGWLPALGRRPRRRLAARLPPDVHARGPGRLLWRRRLVHGQRDDHRSVRPSLVDRAGPGRRARPERHRWLRVRGGLVARRRP